MCKAQATFTWHDTAWAHPFLASCGTVVWQPGSSRAEALLGHLSQLVCIAKLGVIRMRSACLLIGNGITQRDRIMRLCHRRCVTKVQRGSFNAPVFTPSSDWVTRQCFNPPCEWCVLVCHAARRLATRLTALWGMWLLLVRGH